MAKVDLEKIRLAVTAITKSIVATIPNKDNLTMKHKHDVSSDFFKCIIDYGANSKFNIVGEEGKAKEYQVLVIEKGEFKDATFSRAQVIKLFQKAVQQDIGYKISVEEFVEKNMK